VLYSAVHYTTPVSVHLPTHHHSFFSYICVGAMCGSNMVEELDYSHSADPLTAMTSGLEMPFKAPPKLSGLCVKWNRDDTLFDAPSFSPVHHEFKKGRKEKGAGMRTVASAPDFSRLNRLQDTQSTSRSSLSKSFHNNTKEVRNSSCYTYFL
jgi:hypothetical protein